MRKDGRQDKPLLNSIQMKRKFEVAFRGVRIFFQTEPTAWFYLGVAVAVSVIGWLLHITLLEWLAIFLCIGLVFVSEMINSSIEKLSDLVDKNYNSEIKNIKDISAGAVLLAAIISVLVGGFIIVPRLIQLLG